jgi:phosphoenolpyruvate synthase/pyruvate phosphate dikinase
MQFTAEGVWGQGEGLVSGEINPETAVIDYGCGFEDSYLSHSPIRVASRRRKGPQLVKISALDSGGVCPLETTPAERAHGPLDDAFLRCLAAVGCEIAAAKGAPQDIEWCEAGGSLFVVQVRFVAPPLYAMA